MSKRSVIPTGATDIKLFLIRKPEIGEYEAFVSYKSKQSKDFHYIQIGVDDDLIKIIKENRLKL